MKRILLILSIIYLGLALYGQKKAKTRPAPTKETFSESAKIRLKQRMEAEKSLVLLKNEEAVLPIGRLDTIRIALISFGLPEVGTLQELLGRYLKVDLVHISPKKNPEANLKELNLLKGYNLVIFAASDDQKEAGQIPAEDLDRYKRTIQDIAFIKKTVFLLFGSTEFLSAWIGRTAVPAILISDRLDYNRQDLAAQLVFGAIPANSKLTSDLSSVYRKGEGKTTAASSRLRYVLPEELGMDSVRLEQSVDSLVNIGLKDRAFPGCQVLFAKQGKVYFEKCYGYHTYSTDQPVKPDDIYDLASVTKVLAPVPALMMLADQKKFVVSKKMSEYWNDWKGSNKQDIVISDLLSHQARLRAGVTLWPKTMDEQGKYNIKYYSMDSSTGYSLKVAGNLYLIDSYKDSVYKAIRESPLLRSKKYLYSDLGFVILPGVIEKITDEKYEKFLQRKLYLHLGASTLMYRPYLTYPREKIIPTEQDNLFRHELLQGYVHDETAAMMGGVSGNAGLFGSSGDVAKVMQLYLQNGFYGNERFFSVETVQDWTSSHSQKSSNRRGFGFDKPGIQSARHSSGSELYPSPYVSPLSYGHSGYTGTFVWADPSNGLLFVFLSNRVYPDRDNHLITRLKLRNRLLDLQFKQAGELHRNH